MSVIGLERSPLKSDIEKKRSFQALLSVLFLDNLGLTIVYPIFTPLLLKPIYTLLPHHYSLSSRLILLGLLIASFPLAQFIAGPLIGHLADRKGRKTALSIALAGEAVGFTLTGVSMEMMNYSFLLISRFLTGFFAGNLTLCLAAIADTTQNSTERSRKFGIVTSVIGISFVIAIVIGGTLSNDTLETFFNSSLPFWAMTLFCIINLMIIQQRFKDVYVPSNQHLNHFWGGCRELGAVCMQKSLKGLYGIFFFFMLGWIVTLQFLSTFIIEHFMGEKTLITVAFIGVGLAWCLGNIALNRLLTRFFEPGMLLFYSLLISTLMLFLASFAHSFVLFMHYVIIGGLSGSIAWTNCLTLISIKAPNYLQGKLLGINQSVATISMAFAPLFGGLIGEFDIRIIYLFASSSLLISICLLIISKLKKHFN